MGLIEATLTRKAKQSSQALKTALEDFASIWSVWNDMACLGHALKQGDLFQQVI